MLKLSEEGRKRDKQRVEEAKEEQWERRKKWNWSFCAEIMSLNGKVALVTGGAQGIGRAVVHSLLQSSVKVSTVRTGVYCSFRL